FFFFTHPATTDIYTLSLHDALPIYDACRFAAERPAGVHVGVELWICAGRDVHPQPVAREQGLARGPDVDRVFLDALGSEPHLPRSEEHTSELQSRSDLVCRLLLEKK